MFENFLTISAKNKSSERESSCNIRSVLFLNQNLIQEERKKQEFEKEKYTNDDGFYSTQNSKI